MTMTSDEEVAKAQGKLQILEAERILVETMLLKYGLKVVKVENTKYNTNCKKPEHALHKMMVEFMATMLKPILGREDVK